MKTLNTYYLIIMVFVAIFASLSNIQGIAREISSNQKIYADLTIYPLNLKLESTKWLEFKNTDKGEIVLIASTSEGFQVNEFLEGHSYSTNNLDKTLAALDNPPRISIGMANIGNEINDSIVSNGTRFTSLTSSSGVNFHGDYFDDSCPDPAPNSIRIEKDGIINEEVIFYLFDNPIELIPNTECEDVLFSPPHNVVRIVNPQLILTKNDNGEVFIAGKSYVPMPSVLMISPKFDFRQNGRNVFFLNKKIVDHIRQSTADEYRIQKHAHGPSAAELSALIEVRLLDYIEADNK